MEECKIDWFRNKETLTKEQIDHVYKVLSEWRISEVSIVAYYPEDDLISICGPVFKYGLTVLDIRNHGTRITNKEQFDGYDLVMMKWSKPDTVASAPKKQLERKKQPKSYREEPYTLRHRVPKSK